MIAWIIRSSSCSEERLGSGAPDVVQIEYYAMPQFALADSLVDLSEYGLDELEDQYSASTWGRWSRMSARAR
jgi:ABC-type glycerol-3-phosphate transport system substrate-binding protein